MSRSHRLFLHDILSACGRLRAYRERVAWDDPESTPMAIDAVLHNLMVLGEATKNLPPAVRAAAAEIEWRKVAGIRDVLAHGYFSIDLSIIRDIVETRLDDLKAAAERLLAEPSAGG